MVTAAEELPPPTGVHPPARAEPRLRADRLGQVRARCVSRPFASVTQLSHPPAASRPHHSASHSELDMSQMPFGGCDSSGLHD